MKKLLSLSVSAVLLLMTVHLYAPVGFLVGLAPVGRKFSLGTKTCGMV